MSTFEGLHEPLEARDVLLGRTTHVRRLLPNKTRRMIGAWCFLDHYGPDDVSQTGGMWVPPHPHTGLQTVTWLFEGLGRHTDSLGSDQLIRPGQLNVMTAGHGICHAEVSPTDAPPLLHGVQLWVCLPDDVRDTAPADFTHLADLPTYSGPASTVPVLVGSLRGRPRPAPAYTPLVGAEVRLEPGASATRAARPRLRVRRAGGRRCRAARGRRRAGRHAPRWSTSAPGATTSPSRPLRDGAVLMLLGGEPFEEEIVMWWNFVGRSHDEIVAQREAWNGAGVHDEPSRFGVVRGLRRRRACSPRPCPNTRLKARGRAT